RQPAAPRPAFSYSQIGTRFALSGTGLPAASRFRWNFHDGSPIDSVNNPTAHTFLTPGTHRVTFTVISPCGTDSVTRTFTALGVADERQAPTFGLRALPNPTTGLTTLHYALGSAQHVTLDAYNVLGQQVRQLGMGEQQPGAHEAALDLRDLPAGIYVVWLRTEKGTAAIRIVRD
ncbi:MAG TPA: T9SS type A sorting domain-containing protein, partial [bacterium]|nr:T9SS type A sorting domain-containing protein [bacterium]